MSIDRAPFLLLGIVLAAYWGRVLRLAAKARRRTGRSANFWPPEALGRALRCLWIPAVGVWVALPFYAAWAGRGLGAARMLVYWPLVAWAMAIVALGSLLLSRVCWRTMGKDWRMGIDPAERNPLISRGPFARVRHPIYALSMLMMLASAVAIPSPLMIAVAAVHVTLLRWEAAREEQHLLRLHGEAYAEYCRRVGGFFPRGRGA